MAGVETEYARLTRERAERRELRLKVAAERMEQKFLRESQAARNKAARALQKQRAEHRAELKAHEEWARIAEAKLLEEDPAYALEQAVELAKLLEKRYNVLAMDATKARACADERDLESQREANAASEALRECRRKLQSARCCVRYREKQLVAIAEDLEAKTYLE